MEEEARQILRLALERQPAAGTDLATAIRELFLPLGGVDLELPERGPIRDSPDLE
jgi:plasmid stability protein